MLANDVLIRKLSTEGFNNGDGRFLKMIEPFSESVSCGGVISYGLTSAGYDLTLGKEILMFDPACMEVVDPKRFGNDEYRQRVFRKTSHASPGPGFYRNGFVIPPHGYILGTSRERLRIPRFLKGRCVGKSTYARCGILVNTTPLEPGWEGLLTLEIGNITPCPAVVYIGEGIAQVEFEYLTAPPEKDYAQKGGKYQNQEAVTTARIL